VKRALVLGAALPVLLGGLTAACRRERPPASDVVARLAGREIRYSEFERYLRRNSAEPELDIDNPALAALFEQFLDEQALLELAVERGLAEPGDPASTALQALLRAEEVARVEPREIEQYFERHRDRFEVPERVRLRQILTDTRATAQEAATAIAAGEPFEEAARRFSIDPAAAHGGEQGLLTREDLPPEFVDLVFSLPAGGVSGIVTADYGFHLFQVVERYPAAAAPLEEAEPEIRRALAAERAGSARRSLAQEARARFRLRVYEGNLPFPLEPSAAHPTGPEIADGAG
jgi:parvulin-like peptidyl-prolyl isomerase